MTSSVASIARAALLLSNFAWFGAGFVQFSLRSRTSFLKGIRRQPGGPTPTHADHAADVFRYLGAMGGSLALSNLPKLGEILIAGGTGQDKTMTFLFGLWGAAHASQALTTLIVVGPSKRWRWEGLGMGFILYMDLLMWSANWAIWWYDSKA